MNILEYNNKQVKLNFSIDEINILKNALTKIIDCIPKNEFKSRVELSREDTIILKDKIDIFVNFKQLNAQVEFTYSELLALSNSLAEILYRIAFLNFENEVGCNTEKVKSLNKLILQLIKEMTPNTIQIRVIRRTQKLFQIIKPYAIELPRLCQTRKECEFLIGEYRILFLLFSLKNSKTYSGIKIVGFNINDYNNILFKTIVQKIKISYLGDIISYFDEYVDLAKSKSSLDEYALSAINPEKAEIFRIRVLSKNTTLGQQETLEISLKLNVSDEENLNNYFNVQAPVSFNTIYNFTTAIKEYLIDTVNNNSK